MPCNEVLGNARCQVGRCPVPTHPQVCGMCADATAVQVLFGYNGTVHDIASLAAVLFTLLLLMLPRLLLPFLLACLLHICLPQVPLSSTRIQPCVLATLRGTGASNAMNLLIYLPPAPWPAAGAVQRHHHLQLRTYLPPAPWPAAGAVQRHDHVQHQVCQATRHRRGGEWLRGWLARRLAGRLAGWLGGWLAGWLAGRLVKLGGWAGGRVIAG